jgi:hypothetical protein
LAAYVYHWWCIFFLLLFLLYDQKLRRLLAEWQQWEQQSQRLAILQGANCGAIFFVSWKGGGSNLDGSGWKQRGSVFIFHLFLFLISIGDGATNPTQGIMIEAPVQQQQQPQQSFATMYQEDQVSQARSKRMLAAYQPSTFV